MYVPYNQISSNSRAWIYQSDRAFNTAEKTDIESQLTDLCNNWNTHGNSIILFIPITRLVHLLVCR